MGTFDLFHAGTNPMPNATLAWTAVSAQLIKFNILTAQRFIGYSVAGLSEVKIRLADTDGDHVSDEADTYANISLGGRIDSDKDGIPNDCDAACISTGMSADSDDDNDGVLDVNDVFPLISLAGRTDTDGDGVPDSCDANCLSTGLVADALPNDATEYLDTDADLIGNNTDDDDDGDSVLDVNDAFPLISVTGYTDTDNDGRPNDCDTACVALGMTADTDDARLSAYSHQCIINLLY